MYHHPGVAASRWHDRGADHLPYRLAELLPNAQRVEIAAAAHAMHEDNSRAFNAHCIEFLRKASPNRSKITQ